MSLISCKAGVRLKNLSPALAWIFYVLDGYVRHTMGLPEVLVITSINDGTHLANSKHYLDEAVDIRSLNFPDKQSKENFRSGLERALNSHPTMVAQGMGDSFRVLLENPGANDATTAEHFHIQVKKGKEFKGV
jgi:hypothetical protein